MLKMPEIGPASGSSHGATMSDATFGGWRESARPVGEGKGARRARGRTLSIASVALVAALIVGIGAMPPPRAIDAEIKAPPPPKWLAIPKPVQVFSLEAPELVNLPVAYSARRLSDGNGRDDVLAFGSLADGRLGLRLRVSRAQRQAPPPPLYAALARQAADVGLSIDHSGLPDVMPTRFGRFEIVRIALTGGRVATPLSVRTTTPCSGFRLVNDEPGFIITGLACGATDAVPSATLSCLIDRLDLASGGDDRRLIEFFAASELKRNSACHRCATCARHASRQVARRQASHTA